MSKKTQTLKKMNNNLPQLRNPLPPSAIHNVIPIRVPRASFDQNSVRLFFNNVKRGQLEKATRLEAEIARNQHAAVTETLGSMFEVTIYSAKLQDTIGEYRHRDTMRGLEIQEKQYDIYIKQAQAQLIGHEVKLSELDFDVKLKQHKKMEEEA
jgi:hypothetical protein